MIYIRREYDPCIQSNLSPRRVYPQAARGFCCRFGLSDTWKGSAISPGTLWGNSSAWKRRKILLTVQRLILASKLHDVVPQLGFGPAVDWSSTDKHMSLLFPLIILFQRWAPSYRLCPGHLRQLHNTSYQRVTLVQRHLVLKQAHNSKVCHSRDIFPQTRRPDPPPSSHGVQPAFHHPLVVFSKAHCYGCCQAPLWCAPLPSWAPGQPMTFPNCHLPLFILALLQVFPNYFCGRNMEIKI